MDVDDGDENTEEDIRWNDELAPKQGPAGFKGHFPKTEMGWKWSDQWWVLLNSLFTNDFFFNFHLV